MVGLIGLRSALRRVMVVGLTAGCLLVGLLLGAGVSDSGAQGPPTGPGFVAVTPERLLDTRAGLQTGEYDSVWDSGQTRTLKVAGVGAVPADAVAVALHVTTVNPTATMSWLNIYPTGATPDTTAVHNFGAASFTTELVNDLIIAKVGTNGSVEVFNASGQVDLVVDVVGYYSTTDGSQYVPVTPDRFLDTRAGLQIGEYDSPWNPGQTRTLKVTGVGPVPTDALAVALHVTTVNPTADLSWLNIYPTGETAATTAVHNFGSADHTTQLVNDLIIAKVGTNGSVDIFNAHGQVDLVFDIVGYYSTTDGSQYIPATPDRLLDTRANFQIGEYDSPWNAGQARSLKVTGVGPIPADAVAVAMHVTTVNPTADLSWLNIYPTGAAPGMTAVHNFGTTTYTTQLINDLIIAKVGPNGSIDIFNANGQVDLIIDVVGHYGPSSCVINAEIVATVASQPECDALVAFYNSTGGPSWGLQSGWNTATDPCTWHGVRCDAAGVFSISLSNNNLVGQIPPEIGQLTNLSALFLTENEFTELPAEIGQLTNLTALWVHDNQLTALPPEIGQLTNLRQLYVFNNALTTLPPEIGQLTNLDQLLAESNQLTALPAEIGQLTNLGVLILNDNQLTALPPEIGQLSNLQRLWVDGNQLTALPAEIGQLTNLFELYLSRNQLSALPPDLGQLTSLNTLLVAENQLTALPPEIGQLSSLITLVLSENQLASLPPEIGQLTNLRLFFAHTNLLTALPAEIGQLTNLDQLIAESNQLTALPPEIGQLTNLQLLQLSRNQLTALPPEIGQLTNLTLLWVGTNQLASLPPEIGQLTNLDALILGKNQLTSLPPEVGQLTSLTSLDLADNQLAGDITSPMSALLANGQIQTLHLEGQSGCVTVTDAATEVWLDGLNPTWDDGCP